MTLKDGAVVQAPLSDREVRPEVVSTTSHKQILKATGIVGGAQIIIIVVRILRSKIIAVLLGPAGVGIAGLYQSTLDLIRSGTGFGLNFSAVRDIAQAAGTHDGHQIAKTIVILRRWVWFTGLLGMTVTAVFSRALSQYAFGAAEYTSAIRILSVCLVFLALSEGQLALLQGLRRIGVMARANVGGVVAGFCISVPLYWFMGVKGIVPALVLTTAASLLLSWYYARRIPVRAVDVSAKETFLRGLGMVRLGSFMVITAFMMMATMYFVRAYVSKRSGIEAVGQYQAAWTLSAMYLAMVLQAMGADYYPRLSAVNADNVRVVQLANEQTEVALLVAGPLIVAMLSFMHLVVCLLYSSKFMETVSILHWQLAGTFVKIIAWPIGFIILAKGRGGIFVCTELCWNAVYVGLILWGWETSGLEVTGMAYLGTFLIYLAILFATGRVLGGFAWSKGSLKYIMVFGTGTLLAFFNSRYMLGAKGYLVGGILTVATAGYSWHELHKIADLPGVIRRLLGRSLKY